jgi:hypothetical protein
MSTRYVARRRSSSCAILASSTITDAAAIAQYARAIARRDRFLVFYARSRILSLAARSRAPSAKCASRCPDSAVPAIRASPNPNLAGTGTAYGEDVASPSLRG